MAILDRVVREGLPEKVHKHVQSRMILMKNKCYQTDSSEIEVADAQGARSLLLPKSSPRS